MAKENFSDKIPENLTEFDWEVAFTIWYNKHTKLTLNNDDILFKNQN